MIPASCSLLRSHLPCFDLLSLLAYTTYPYANTATVRDSKILDRLSPLDTDTVSDAFDFLSLDETTVGVQPLWDCPKIARRASTVTLARKTDTVPKFHLITPVVDATTADDRILVIAGGFEGISFSGDIIANASKMKKIRGTVIDGFSRDIDGSRDIGFPVYGRGVTMFSARDRVVQVDSGSPLLIQDVVVKQDDYVIADRCGTVFVPAERI